jgi:hypothetical protein
VPGQSLEATLDRPAAPPPRPQVPAEQRWWEQRQAPTPWREQGGPGDGSPGRERVSRAPRDAAPASSSAPRPWAPQPAPAAAAAAAAPAGGALPAPPPLSAPLSMAGTGPMPQLRQTMVPPGDTIWWTLPPAGSGPPGYGRPVPPMPRGYPPHGPAPPSPVPMAGPAPGPARAAGPQPAPALGAIALGLGIVLLIIGAASHVSVIVIGGLVAGAWGVWRLVTGTGRGRKPPGPT